MVTSVSALLSRRRLLALVVGFVAGRPNHVEELKMNVQNDTTLLREFASEVRLRLAGREFRATPIFEVGARLAFYVDLDGYSFDAILDSASQGRALVGSPLAATFTEREFRVSVVGLLDWCFVSVSMNLSPHGK